MTLGTPQKKDPFRLLLDVGAALVSSATGEEALQHVAAAIGAAMNVATVDIQEYDADSDCLVEVGIWARAGLSDEDRAYLGVAIPLSERPSFRPILESRELIEARADDPDLPAEERAMFERWGYQTTLDAPLVIGDEVLGVLGVTETRFPRRFLSMELERFGQLAGIAAAAIRNARVYRREADESRRRAALLRLIHVCASGAAAGEIAAAGRTACVDGLGAARTDLVAGESIPEPRVEQGRDGVRLAVPVSLGGADQALVVTWDDDRAVSDDEIEFVSAVAGQVSVAVEDAALEAERDAG